MQASLASRASCARASASFAPGVSIAHHASSLKSNSVRLDPYGEADFLGVSSSEASFATSVVFPVREGPSTVKQRIGDPPCQKHASESKNASKRRKALDMCSHS